MKLAIIGSRNCPPIRIEDYFPFVPDTIVSGGARGVDSYAKHYAVNHNIPIIEYLPDYKQYGRSAPFLRNIQIVETCDYLLAFWDGVSHGTKFTIDYANRYGVPHKVIMIK